MNVFNVTNLDEDPVSLKIHKPCTCVFMCCNRPVIYIDYCEDGTDVFIGKIEDEYDFCNFNFNVRDETGAKKFRVHASCMQCGIICSQCCCTACETVKFEVMDADG